MRVVQQLSGHVDLRMTERYTDLVDTILRAAVQVLPALPILPGNGNANGAPAPLNTIPATSEVGPVTVA